MSDHETETTRYCQVVFPVPLSQSFSYRWQGSAPLPQPGSRVKAEFGRRLRQGWLVAVSEKRPDYDGELKPLVAVIDEQPLADRSTLDLAQWLADFHFCSLGQALAAMLPGAKRPRQLDDLVEVPQYSAAAVQLSAAQQQALEQWRASPASYLFGVTGSGKTEVFLRAAEEILAKGAGIIYLVPEISLVYQLAPQLQRRFGSQLAILHSQLTPSQKLQEWRRIQTGQARFVLGARSAVFAPLADLGLIIVDEEHENSYKAGSRPRYHARQVAMYRCRQAGAQLLLGSATPSMEAWQAVKRGILTKMELPQRISGQMPLIEVLDLNQYRGQLLTPAALSAVEECCQRQQQVVFFLNQRGFATSWYCFHCRQALACPHCSLSLTVYRQQGRCRCHYCGYRQKIPQECPHCAGLDFGYLGFGTEQLEQHLEACFPHLRIKRMDSDSTHSRGSSAQILAAFGRGEIDLLLGTQMVIKGLHFPKVQLVVVVLADGHLNLPDFRSAERCFAQLLQACGRAGRFHQNGRVLLQTYRPEHPLIRAVVEGKMADFVQTELQQRKQFDFPPFSRLIRLLFSSSDQHQLYRHMDCWCQWLQDGPWQLLGPSDCAISKVANRYRGHILLSSHRFNAAHQSLSHIWQRYQPQHGVKVDLDLDPVDLL